MIQEALVSIIIRAKNEGKSLISLLPLLYSQKMTSSFEIIILENASTDQTSQIIKNYPKLRIHKIPAGQFHPSKSLNDAAKIAGGKILVHLSAHCFPTSFFWLQNLTQPIINNPRVLATYGRQFTDPNVNAYEEIDYSQLLFPKEGMPKVKAFSSANSAVRKNYLLDHPFSMEIAALEDHLWSLEIPEQNQILYLPKAEVLHLHPLFNLKYYIPRWQKEGSAVFYINQVKKFTSPMTDFREFNNLLSPARILTFFRIAISLMKKRLILYALFAPVFYFLRDWSWKKGLSIAALKTQPLQGLGP